MVEQICGIYIIFDPNYDDKKCVSGMETLLNDYKSQLNNQLDELTKLSTKCTAQLLNYFEYVGIFTYVLELRLVAFCALLICTQKYGRARNNTSTDNHANIAYSHSRPHTHTDLRPCCFQGHAVLRLRRELAKLRAR